jgi:hypothetical protein
MAGTELSAKTSALGYSILVGLIATWITMSELLQVCGEFNLGLGLGRTRFTSRVGCAAQFRTSRQIMKSHFLYHGELESPEKSCDDGDFTRSLLILISLLSQRRAQ